ncbi:chloride channel protein [Mycobacterium leprae]|uniref:chloride channel protein n=1 Tax=Mycobacterium leprae TaxID=1769 RepID=UPI0002EBCBC9|nr:chloride channel protein [Mycobacterium leprae]OAR21250.1 hypothetical protein A8144_07305 [Mycobacterium leprae 3125609]OAX71360.1 hypothetical protein A3216_06195 [Mycobacterium leprae 7935681]
MVVNALTIGSGGSAGREDPTAPISAGFALLLTRRLGLSDKNGRIAAALGISTIFTAPLDDGSMAVSIVYRDNCDHRQLIPGLITPGRAYAVHGSVLDVTLHWSTTSTPCIASKKRDR